jgi:hypothetical protein
MPRSPDMPVPVVASAAGEPGQGRPGMDDDDVTGPVAGYGPGPARHRAMIVRWRNSGCPPGWSRSC